jgi:hypothetical protein
VHEGLYESLLTRRLQALINAVEGLDAYTGAIDDADQPEVLSRHVRQAVHRALSMERTAEGRRSIVNRVLRELGACDDEMLDAPTQLLSLARPASPGVVARRVTRPSTPLADAALLTNSHGEPSMGAELRAELDTADRVDLLCAFVKWSGLRILEPELARARERGVPLRVITTTYVGATERGALDRLVRHTQAARPSKRGTGPPQTPGNVR